ncbi:hypothetical protein GWI33_000435, partial [Rhynchophorus ferrugineus]
TRDRCPSHKTVERNGAFLANSRGRRLRGGRLAGSPRHRGSVNETESDQRSVVDGPERAARLNFVGEGPGPSSSADLGLVFDNAGAGVLIRYQADDPHIWPLSKP